MKIKYLQAVNVFRLADDDENIIRCLSENKMLELGDKKLIDVCKENPYKFISLKEEKC